MFNIRIRSIVLWLPESLAGDVLGGSFGLVCWGAETLIDGGGMGDESNYEGGGVCGIRCCN